ncbi:hypothetical protein C8A00DRAFT_31421 [Chaetomidium leptoderma]|uniref:Uncharacterized protein n=1 Tax=Chaetomidium leptoderma TaxID=669021 RepID=A0AAN6VQ62_9PEZI|nr:hypothetical protein C8A00DRAFT_31421 [Chaetomidium leptoderma]
MPITLPTTSSPTTGTTTGTTTTNPILTTLQTRLLPRPDLSTTQGKSIAAILVLRAVYNLVHFVLTGLSGKPVWCLFYVADQLVIAYAVSFIAAAAAAGGGGERRVFGGVTVGERFFELFLVGCAVAHVLYVFVLVICVVSLAIFFGVTGGAVMTVVGVVMVLVAVLASRPDAEGAGLSLP